MTDWRDLFCGRGAELRELCEAYDAVAAGGGPRLIVVLGERGMGKTRLVQEFYRTLSRERDPDDYWPDAPLFRGRNLLFAPDVEGDPAVQAHFAGFALEARRMPFLWWGFRLSDPDDRNALATDLTTHRRFLDLHLEPMRHARRLAAHRDAVVEMGRDAAASGMMKAIEAIPIVGSAIGLALEGGLFARRAARLKAERESLLDRQRTEHLSRMAQTRSDDLVSTTLADLAEWMELAGNGIPLVLFVDDAQFARGGGDEGVLRLLSDLWPRAVEGGWPLLLVATHWEADWWRSAGAPPGDRPDLGALFTALLQHSSPGWRPLVLGRESGLAGLVRAGLEGLPPADVSLILEKADGNPQLLLELIERIRRSPAWRSRDGALSAVGRAQLQSARLALHELIRERMENEGTSDEVRRAVAVSSIQGVEFSCSLAEEAAALLQAGPVRDGLEAAEETHRFVSGVQRGVAGFLQRAYRDAALSLVEGHFGSRDVVMEALVRATERVLDDPERWQGLNPMEQDAALALRASLQETSPDPVARLQAARTMVAIVRRTLDTEDAVDVARGARWARTFSAGLADGRWRADAFSGTDLARMHEVLAYWDGPAAALVLARAVVERFREELEGEGNGTASPPSPMVGSGGAGDPPPGPGDLVVALWKLATALERSAGFDEAAELEREASERVRALVAADPSPATRWMLAAALEHEGGAARSNGDPVLEESIRREALTLMLEIEAIDPENATVRLERIRAMLHLATCLELGEPTDEALALMREALVAQTALLQEGLQNRYVRDGVAILMALGDAEARRGAAEAASRMYRHAVAAARGAFEVEPTQDHRRIVGVVCGRVAEAAWDAGDAETAHTLIIEAMEVLEEITPPPDPTHAVHLSQYIRRAARFVQEGGSTRPPGTGPDATGGSGLPGSTRSRDAALRSLLHRFAPGMATHPTLVCWSYVEVAGRLAAELELEGKRGDVEVLRQEVIRVLEAIDVVSARANWFHGALLGSEAAVFAAQDRGDAAGRAAALDMGLRWAVAYDTDLDDDESRGDLLWWIVMAGHQLLEMGVALDPSLHDECVRRVLAPPPPDEGESTGRMRSSALSLLATLGTHLPPGERGALLAQAGVWFEMFQPPALLPRLAGYEAEVTLGAVEQTQEECRGVLAVFADAARQAIADDAALHGSLEWRFLQRMAHSWGCVLDWKAVEEGE